MKAIGTVAKHTQINFFAMLRINQKLGTTGEIIWKKKKMACFKNNEP